MPNISFCFKCRRDVKKSKCVAYICVCEKSSYLFIHSPNLSCSSPLICNVKCPPKRNNAPSLRQLPTKVIITYDILGRENTGRRNCASARCRVDSTSYQQRERIFAATYYKRRVAFCWKLILVEIIFFIKIRINCIFSHLFSEDNKTRTSNFM